MSATIYRNEEFIMIGRTVVDFEAIGITADHWEGEIVDAVELFTDIIITDITYKTV